MAGSGDTSFPERKSMGGLEDREIVVLVLGLIVAGFALAHLRRLRRLPRWKWAMMAAGILLLGWSCSILETWFAPSVFNMAEHCAYVAHSALMLLWASGATSRRSPGALGRPAR